MHRLAVILLSATLFTVCAFQPVKGATYSVQPLGIAPGYDGSFATDINENGVAICISLNIYDTSGAFTWSRNDGFTNLSGRGIQTGSGINNQGQIVGVRKDEAAGLYRPYIRNADGMERDVLIPVGAAYAWPVSINNDGWVIVDLNYRDVQGEIEETRTAIINEDGSTTFVEYPNGYTSVREVSSNGTIIVDGYMWTEAGGLRALPWLTGDVDVRAVNDSGWVVGITNGHALRWDSNGNFSDLGTAIMGMAFGINNLGQVVGTINGNAVIWNTDNSVTELPLPEGYTCSSGYAINNIGQVVGEGTSANGQRIALFWEPVPEPSSFAVLACGLVGVLTRIRKRRT